MTIPTLSEIKTVLKRRYDRHGIDYTPERLEQSARMELVDYQAKAQARDLVDQLATGLNITWSQRVALFNELAFNIGYAGRINLIENLAAEMIGRKLFVSYQRKPSAECHPLLIDYRILAIGVRGKKIDRSRN